MDWAVVMSRKKIKNPKRRGGKKYEALPEPLFKPLGCGMEGCIYTEDAIPKHCEAATNTVIKIQYMKRGAVSELQFREMIY